MFNVAVAARVLGAKHLGADAEVRAVTIDSRAVRPGDLFVALPGERVDGHDFVDGALAAGAAAAIVTDPSRVATAGAPLIVVPDARLALGSLAAWWRGRLDPVVAGVTGSSGKTTVKEMLAAILRAHAGDDAVLATEGNLNNDLGLPLTLLRLRAQHRFAVIEMGMNHLGEIAYLTRLARPRAAVINNAGTAHIGEVGSRDNIARAKGEIFEGLAADGVKIINADDDYADFWRNAHPDVRVVSFGLDRRADVTAAIEPGADASLVTLTTPAGSTVVRLHVPGIHNVRNALAAAAVAHAFDVPLATIAAGLSAYQGTKGRMQRCTGPSGAVVIDDTYNANPDSMRAAIDWLATQPGRRLFVMGDMGELGDGAAAMHEDIGRFAATRCIDDFYALGTASAAAVRAFGAHGRHFNDLDTLVAAVVKACGPDTTLLVKGSRFMRMERVVARLADGAVPVKEH